MRVRTASSFLVLLDMFIHTLAAARWREVAANGTWPEPRFSHTAVLLGNSSHMLLFGGNNFDASNELFAFDIGRREWSKHKAAGTPPSKRYGHQAVITADNRMVIFGGYNGSFLSDVHELRVDVASNGTLTPHWRKVDVSGVPPSARDGHSAVLAPDGKTMLVYGGFDGKTQLADLVALDTESYEWSRPRLLPAAEGASEAVGADAPDAGDGDAGSDGHGEAEEEEEEDEEDEEDEEAAEELRAVAVPPPRYLHSAVACASGMVVYGGYLAGGDFADDLWLLQLEGGATSEARWSRLRASGNLPLGTFGHAAAIDASGKHMWLSGGFGGGGKGGKQAFSNELHVLDIPGRKWSRLASSGAVPSPRHKHTLIATSKGKLLLFGGNDFGPTRGFYELDTAAALLPAPSPLAALLLGAVQLIQLIALVTVAIASWMRRLGLLSMKHTAAVMAAALMYLFGLEHVAPPPGAFVARALRRPKAQPKGKRAAILGFEKTALSTASDVAAAIAAAGVASLVASAGGPPMRPAK